MSEIGLLCLKWNKHLSAFEKLLSNLYLKDVYSDATLICQGKFYPIHQFVMSTCSDYFEEIFRQSIKLKCKHPFIIVKDMQPSQIEALLNYMYKGEVNVPQEMLPELIRAAETFKIKGLAVNDDDIPVNKSVRDRKRSNASPCLQNKRSKTDGKQEKTNKCISREKLNAGTAKNYKQNHSYDDPLKSKFNTSMDETDVYENFENKESDDQTLFLMESEQSVAEIKLEPIEELSDDELSESNRQRHIGSAKEASMKQELQINSLRQETHCHSQGNESHSLETEQESSWDGHYRNGESSEEADSTERVLPHSSQQTIYSEGTSDIQLNLFCNEAAEINWLSCEKCAFKCLFKEDFEKHIRQHTKERAFACPHCPYKSYKSYNLQIHIRTHTGEKPFKCPYCPHTTTQSSSIRTHIKTHLKKGATNDEIFPCLRCSQIFSSNTDLKNHMPTHYKTSQVHCLQCPFTAFDNNELLDHMTQH